MSDNEQLPFQQTISEADIDWLFCVELNTCEDFQAWVGSVVFKGITDLKHVWAWRSVYGKDRRESDLIWLVDTSSQGRQMGLIENKITARAQPDQYEGYVERAAQYVSEDLFAQKSVIALLAPAEYNSPESEFYPVKITYESVVCWLSRRSDNRSCYLKSLYETAIFKHKESTSEVDPEVLAWRKKVWELGRVKFSELNPRPDYYPNETWVVMPHPKSGYKLHYKSPKNTPKSRADIELPELAHRDGGIKQLEAEYAERLGRAKPFCGSKIAIVKTTKFVTFRLEVPRAEEPPVFDKASVKKALRAVRHLKEWWENTK